MFKSDVFAALRARGATKAVVSFSGGNDEGGSDQIVLFNGDKKLEREITVDHYYDDEGELDTRPNADELRLSEALQGPVNDRYGSFAGDFYVSGKVVWDAVTGKVEMHANESVPEDHEVEAEW